MSDLLAARRALEAGAALFDRSDRERLAVTGPDRAKFLHNLTTNEVKRLPAGRGCEAFVTSPQGKTLGYVQLLAEPDRILLRTDPGALAPLLPHLGKYGMFDDVAWDDLRDATFEFHLAGPAAEPAWRSLGIEPPGPDDLAHAPATLGGADVVLVREAPTGQPGWTILGPSEGKEAVRSALRDSIPGLVEPDAAAFDALRIAAGTPAAGRDVTADNLPQEVGRDRRAIHFVKGCYLGQETVARIDALGHVNRILRRLEVDTDRPIPAGAPLRAGDKPVGSITSAAPWDGPGRQVALGYVRVAQAGPGAELAVDLGDGSAAARVLPGGE